MGNAPLPVPGEEGPVFTGPDGKFLVGIIHQQAVPVKQVRQHFLPEASDTGLERQLGVFSADIHRIILDTAGLTDILIRARLSGKPVFSEQTLFQQDEFSRLVLCDSQHNALLKFAA